MSKSITAVAAALTTTFTLCVFAGSAGAAPPADQDACNTLAFSLAEKAAGKNLPKDDAVKVDEMIAKLEGQCGAGKLTEAEATANDIEAALAK